jgi:hypothetical protein
MQYLDEADTLDRRRGLDVASRERPDQTPECRFNRPGISVVRLRGDLEM